MKLLIIEAAIRKFNNYEIKTEKDFQVLNIKQLIELIKSRTIKLSKRSKFKIQKYETTNS